MTIIKEQDLNIHYNETIDGQNYHLDTSVYEYHEGFVYVSDDPS